MYSQVVLQEKLINGSALSDRHSSPLQNGKKTQKGVLTMDFSSHVDPLLQSTSPSSSSSSLEFLTLDDFDHYLHGSFLPVSSVYQTIEPSQLSEDMSPSSSPSSPTSPASLSSTIDPSDSSSSSSSYPRRRYNKRNSTTAATPSPVHAHSPYEKDHHVKRHQTKLACTWCRKLSKKCDAQRPCGRCIQFNRCDECVDAPPRRPRAKGIDRGAYKKTRDLATINYQEAVSRREAYVAKQERIGRIKRLGLSADEILEKARKDEAKMDKENQKENMPLLLEPGKGGVASPGKQGGSTPFTGPLEDLFTCSASPEIEELSISSPPSAGSLFDVLSPTDSYSSVTDYDESDLPTSWHWETMNRFPNVMELVATAQAAQITNASDEWQPWSDIALVA